MCNESFTQEEFLDEHICIDHKCEKYWLIYKSSIKEELIGKPKSSIIKQLLENPTSDLSEKRKMQLVGKPSPGKKNPNNICSLCGKAFTTRGYLGTHLHKIHNCINYKQLLDASSASEAFDMKTVTEQAFWQHVACNETENINEAHICPLCNNSFTRLSDLSRHIITIHKTTDYKVIFKCPDCDFETLSCLSIVKHFYRYHSSNSALTKDQRLKSLDAVSYHCDLCGRQFRQMSDISAHIKNHIKIPLHCEECDIVYSTKDDYKRHNLVHHGNCFSCRRCGDVFETVAEIASHRLNVHGKGKNNLCRYKLLTCQKCGKLFSKERLKSHMLTVHAEDRQRESYICDVCGQKYLTKLPYFNHLREHKGLKRLKCKICNSLFMSEENLAIHKLEHPKGSRPYKCRYCDAAYTRHDRRRMHENVKHIRNYSKKCPDCGKLFLDNKKLKVHSVVHTKQRKYECDVCGMKFSQASSLCRHKKIHSEDKKHECTECGLKFFQKYSLTRHLLVHSGDKPHQCSQCPQAFRQVFMLTQHVRKQHSKAE